MNGEKERLRRAFLKKRRELGETERTRLSEKIMEQLRTSLLFRDASLVLAYAPLPEEADIGGVRALCYETGKRIAYPKVQGGQIDFYELLPDEELKEGTFHVPEPVVTEGKNPAEWGSALCLIPGAAFDGYGHRYGYGKGYYDRYLAAHPDMTRVGVCFSAQLSDRPLLTSDTDIPMHYLLTERGIARCASERSK